MGLLTTDLEPRDGVIITILLLVFSVAGCFLGYYFAPQEEVKCPTCEPWEPAYRDECDMACKLFDFSGGTIWGADAPCGCFYTQDRGEHFLLEDVINKALENRTFYDEGIWRHHYTDCLITSNVCEEELDFYKRAVDLFNC